jgi:hypothetical protein
MGAAKFRSISGLLRKSGIAMPTWIAKPSRVEGAGIKPKPIGEFVFIERRAGARGSNAG